MFELESECYQSQILVMIGLSSLAGYWKTFSDQELAILVSFGLFAEIFCEYPINGFLNAPLKSKQLHNPATTDVMDPPALWLACSNATALSAISTA